MGRQCREGNRHVSRGIGGSMRVNGKYFVFGENSKELALTSDTIYSTIIEECK